MLCGEKQLHQARTMKIMLLQLYVLTCCQYAVTDLITDLGSNVTINCDLDEDEVYWILLKTADPPTVILRSFSTQTKSPFYHNKTFRKNYSVQSKHRLVINNVTADELGVYYCMNTETPPKLSNSTRIYFKEPVQISKCLDHTHWQIIIIISGLMNGLLIMVVIGLVKVFVVGNRRSPEQLNTDLQLQYAEVDFSKLRRNIRSSQINSTYAALQLPKS
ncbi:uncharacterized protein LOC122327157 [Puntigrus tetrazona]|uniref:uncharacterized protein LOC122327157 n=1 Tax=Puntigrus tetrazona TaxID=1606681 RepID=UPI001C8AAB5C|nr:uncharacterized protein LOC122327157 [Puntigrus tetrazona]